MSKVLLQIFSGTVVRPVFFEFIQQADGGFGEGNFRALNKSVEEDQIGVIGVAAADGPRSEVELAAALNDARRIAAQPLRSSTLCPLRATSVRRPAA